MKSMPVLSEIYDFLKKKRNLRREENIEQEIQKIKLMFKWITIFDERVQGKLVGALQVFTGEKQICKYKRMNKYD